MTWRAYTRQNSMQDLTAFYTSFRKADVCNRCMFHKFAVAVAVLMTLPCIRAFAVCSVCIIYSLSVNEVVRNGMYYSRTSNFTTIFVEQHHLTVIDSSRWIHTLNLALGRITMVLTYSFSVYHISFVHNRREAQHDVKAERARNCQYPYLLK